MKTWLVAAVLVAGCSDDESATCEVDGGEACFELPTAPIATYKMGASTTPSLGCAKLTPVNSMFSTNMNGTVKHYTSGAQLAGVQLEYHGTTAFSTMLASGMTAADGTFMIALGAAPDLLHLKATGSAILPSYYLYLHYDLTQPEISMLDYRGPTPDLLATITGIVRVDAKPGTAVMALAVNDCDGASIEHAIVTISSTSKTATHVPGFNTFYTPPGDLPIPVLRSERADTNNNGAVGILNVPPGQFYAQAWGFIDASAMSKGKSGLRLIAEWPIPSFADAAIGATLRPSEGPL